MEVMHTVERENWKRILKRLKKVGIEIDIDEVSDIMSNKQGHYDIEIDGYITIKMRKVMNL